MPSFLMTLPATGAPRSKHRTRNLESVWLESVRARRREEIEGSAAALLCAIDPIMIRPRTTTIEHTDGHSSNSVSHT